MPGVLAPSPRATKRLVLLGAAGFVAMVTVVWVVEELAVLKGQIAKLERSTTNQQTAIARLAVATAKKRADDAHLLDRLVPEVPDGRCGPRFHNKPCDCEKAGKPVLYCADSGFGDGWCGEQKAHKDASSGMFDCNRNIVAVPSSQKGVHTTLLDDEKVVSEKEKDDIIQQLGELIESAGAPAPVPQGREFEIASICADDCKECSCTAQYVSRNRKRLNVTNITIEAAVQQWGVVFPFHGEVGSLRMQLVNITWLSLCRAMRKAQGKIIFHVIAIDDSGHIPTTHSDSNFTGVGHQQHKAWLRQWRATCATPNLQTLDRIEGARSIAKNMRTGET